MAISIGTIEAVLRLRDELTPTLKRVSDDIVQLGSTMRRTGTEVRELGSAMTVGITAPLVAGAGAALKFSADFESAMTKVGTITNIGIDGIADMRQEILDLAPTVGIGPTPLSEALLVVASTGLKGADAVAVLTAAAKASAIGLGDTKDVARAVTSAIKAYGIENITAEEATNKLFVAVKEGGAEATEFAGTLGRVVGIASQVGVSFDEVLASMATFTRLGVNASEAATALRGILGTLADPSKEAAEELLKVGTSVDELRASVKEKGLQAALGDLVVAFRGNEDAMAKVFGNVRALAGVMGTAGAQGEAYAEVLRSISGASNEADEAFKETSKTIAFSWNQAMAKAQALAIQFGDAIAPVFRDVIPHVSALVDWLSRVVSWFSTLPPGVQTAAVAFLALVAALGPLTYLLGNLMAIAGGVTKVIGAVAGAFTVQAGAAGLSSRALGANAIAAGAAAIAQDGLAKALKFAAGEQLAFNFMAASGSQMLLPLSGAMAATSAATTAVGTAAATASVGVGTLVTALGFLIAPLAAAAYGLHGLFTMSQSDIDKWAESGAFAVGEFGTAVVSTTNKVTSSVHGMSSMLQGTAEEVNKQWVAMQLDRQVAQLTAEFNHLTDSVRPTAEQFNSFYTRAKALADQGAKLGVTLSGVVAGGLRDVKKATEGVKLVKLNEEAQKLADSLGKDIKKAAADYVSAVESVGGITQLTRDEQLAYADALDAAIEKLKLAGPTAENLLLKYQALRFELPQVERAERLHANALGLTQMAADKAETELTLFLKTLKEIGPTLDSLSHMPPPPVFFDVKNIRLQSMAGARAAQEQWLDVMREIGDATPETIAPPGMWQQVKGIFQSNLGSLNDIFMRAFEGGGGVGGAIQSFATKVTSNLLKMVPVIGEFLSQFAGAIVSGVKKIFGGLFGGVSEAEKAGRKLADQFRKGLEDGLNDSQRTEAGNDRWKMSLIAIRDAYLAVGRTAADANAIAERLWRAEKQGADAVRKVIDEINVAFEEQKRLTAFFEDVLPSALDEVAKSGGLVTAEFRDMLTTLERMGPATEAINEFFLGQANRASGGLAAALKAGADATRTLKDRTDDLRKAQEALNEARQRFGVGSDEYDDAIDKVRELTAEIDKQRSIIGGAGVTNAASAMAFGNAIAATFAIMVERGMGFADALRAIAPAVDDLRAQLEATGLSGGAAFDKIARLAELAAGEITGPILESVAGLNDALIGLNNTGLLSQEMFAGLTGQIRQAFDALVQNGATAEEALALMQPTLQTVWELMEDFGLEVDAATMELIEQAKNAGIVGEAHRAASEKAQRAQERLAAAMERVADVLERVFGDAGDQVEEFESRSDIAVSNVTEFFDQLRNEVENTMDAVDDLADAIENMGGISGPSHGDNRSDEDRIAEFLRDNPGDEHRIGSALGIPGYAGGTHGKFVDFGAGQTVRLHGKERVMTEGESTGGGVARIEVPVYLDGREVARVVAENLPDVLAKMGVRP